MDTTGIYFRAANIYWYEQLSKFLAGPRIQIGDYSEFCLLKVIYCIWFIIDISCMASFWNYCCLFTEHDRLKNSIQQQQNLQ